MKNIKSSKGNCKSKLNQTNQNHSSNVKIVEKLLMKYEPKEIRKALKKEFDSAITKYIYTFVNSFINKFKNNKALLSKKPKSNQNASYFRDNYLKKLGDMEFKYFRDKKIACSNKNMNSVYKNNQQKPFKSCLELSKMPQIAKKAHKKILKPSLSGNTFESLNSTLLSCGSSSLYGSDCKKYCKNANNYIQRNNNDSDDDDDDEEEDEDESGAGEVDNDAGGEGGGGGGEAGSDAKTPTKADDGQGANVLYVDACSLWKFPSWLVERLDIDQVVRDFATLSIERYRSLLMRQIKCTATDLLLYQTVRREFLRTILVIELNNIVKLMDHIEKLGLDTKLKNEFFQRLKPIVTALDNPEKVYIPEMEEMAYVLDELYILIAPAHVMKGQFSYHFNIIYCSFLLSHWAVSFNENCPGGIVDNTWFANESKYYCMVMVTPQVYHNSSKSEADKIANSKFRVEAYFDIDRGSYTGFDYDFSRSVDTKYILTRTIECLIYSYLTKEAHWVEDKNIFLLNGPDVKGNIDFTKIYYSLIRKATL